MLIDTHSTVWKYQSQIKHYSIHRSFKITSPRPKSSQSQMNIWKMVEGRKTNSSMGKEQKSNWSPRWKLSIFCLLSPVSRILRKPSWQGLWKRGEWKMTLYVHLAQRAQGLGLLPEQRYRWYTYQHGKRRCVLIGQSQLNSKGSCPSKKMNILIFTAAEETSIRAWVSRSKE